MSRVLTITSTAIITSGQGTKGPWTLRSVEALDEQGQPISQQLKTFADLPLGQVEVEVEVKPNEQYGPSYMLKPVRNSSAPHRGGGGDTTALEQRVARLEAEVQRLSGLVDRRELAPAGTAPPATGVTPGIPDDDIPF